MTPEEFIKEYTMGCSNDITPIGNYDHTYQEWLTPEQALQAVKIAREELIDEAWNYINNQLNLPNDFEQHFRKALKK